MKKIISIFLFVIMLSGCGNVSENNVEDSADFSSEEFNQSTTAGDGVYLCVESMIKYDTLDEFKGSEFYNKIKADGFIPYLLEYDDDKYEFEYINSDARFYEYILNEKATQKRISFTIEYDTYMTDVEQFGDNAPKEQNIKTTAERNGQVYDVYLSTSAYDAQENYALNYLPFDGYGVSLYAGRNSTPEEILSYFDDFELVAVN